MSEAVGEASAGLDRLRGGLNESAARLADAIEAAAAPALTTGQAMALKDYIAVRAGIGAGRSGSPASMPPVPSGGRLPDSRRLLAWALRGDRQIRLIIRNPRPGDDSAGAAWQAAYVQHHSPSPVKSVTVDGEPYEWSVVATVATAPYNVELSCRRVSRDPGKTVDPMPSPEAEHLIEIVVEEGAPMEMTTLKAAFVVR
ncbi:hypothetical protein ABZ464_40705 [Streptomyces sp. NPDC005820]|uniref:hypothetical protein n=1 Tax=Streptomyces sp. NPDC005820 TaxID=3157069 RepID=UPI0033CFE095